MVVAELELVPVPAEVELKRRELSPAVAVADEGLVELKRRGLS